MDRRKLLRVLAATGGGAAPTYTISGAIFPAVEGVTVALGAYFAQTAVDGTYTIGDIPEGTSGNLTATKSLYTFSPATISISAMSGNLTAQNFGVAAYNMVAGLSNWASAKSSGHPLVWFWGDSTGVGQGATVPATDGWMQKLIVDIKSNYGDRGKYYINGDGEFTSVGANWVAGDWCAQNNNKGFIHNNVTSTNLVFTATGRYFDVLYLDRNTTGPCTVQFDADAPVNLEYGAGVLTYKKVSFDAGSNGSHTITIAPGALLVFIGGILVRDDTAGAVIHNASYAGAYSNGFALGAAGNGALSTISPSLVVIGLGLNDYKNVPQVSLSAYETNIRALVSEAGAGSSVLLMSENPSQVAPNPNAKSAFNEVLYDIALDLGLAYIDTDLLMGGTWAAADAAGYMFDSNHPNTVGYNFIYDQIVPYVTA